MFGASYFDRALVHRHMLKSYLESHFYRLQIGNNLSRFESKIRGGKENLHAISRPIGLGDVCNQKLSM